MSYGLAPATTKALVEAEADIARHGVVIIRTLETELAPSIMAAARDSLEGSPKKLAEMKDDELDELIRAIRKSAARSTRELSRLYTRLIAKLGNLDILDLEKDLEGIDQLFKWQRINNATEPVSAILEERGFSPIELAGPEDVADNLKVELEDKWRSAFSRFEEAVHRAAEELKEQEPSKPPRRKKTGEKRK